MEKKHSNADDASNQLDSPINTDGAKGNEGKAKSLTITEDPDTDPNKVANKPSFSDNENANDRGKFDGEMGI